jgi:nucleoside-diphosphate-sugar epimerase
MAAASSSQRRKVLITGGAGFVGSHLADELLAHGHHVPILAMEAGAQVIGTSRRNGSLKTAEAFGAVESLPMLNHTQIIKQVRQLTGGRLCDVVIEATGKQWPLQLASELTRDWSRLFIAGYH